MLCINCKIVRVDQQMSNNTITLKSAVVECLLFAPKTKKTTTTKHNDLSGRHPYTQVSSSLRVIEPAYIVLVDTIEGPTLPPYHGTKFVNGGWRR